MEYTELLEKQIIGRLKVDNPWWTEGSIPDYYAKMSPRLYLDIFMPLVQATGLRRALILMGPRRVGKTVMMYHAIQRLIDSGVSAQNIIYISEYHAPDFFGMAWYRSTYLSSNRPATAK